MTAALRMKTSLILLVVMMMALCGCASQPSKKFPAGLSATEINLPSDQKIISDQIGRPWATLASGKYKLRWENEEQRFFANATETIILSGKEAPGGISYYKKKEGFSVYEKILNPPFQGELARAFAPKQEKDTIRVPRFWILGDEPLTWKYDGD